MLPSAATGLDPGGSHTQGSGWEGSIMGDGRLGGWTDGVLKVYETRPGRVWELAPDSLGARVAWWWEMIHKIPGWWEGTSRQLEMRLFPPWPAGWR